MEVMGSSSLVKDVADDNLSDTELRLGLPGCTTAADAPPSGAGAKRALEEDGEEESHARSGEELASPAKAQAVGWPPIRSYRRNNLQARKAEAEAAGLYVKVSMDGAPYLRKIDLKVYKGYEELRQALDSMFRCFSLGEASKRGLEYAMTYEDRDGDCMMVGDVPWEMFISSCRRLRIMKGSEARGLESTQ